MVLIRMQVLFDLGVQVQTLNFLGLHVHTSQLIFFV